MHGNEVLRKLAARRGRQVTLLVVFSSGLGSTSGDASELLTGLGSIAHAISQTPHGDPAAAAAVAQVLRKGTMAWVEKHGDAFRVRCRLHDGTIFL
ncbi:hypothetical protein [Lentzea terrae]|uniref:hypothetical protein n=1 Tax=Lentzea terrae TaxID=2200761 RepID=UPI000DD3042F|nr:hypothetical protein [Lentzea terrae]